MMSRFMFLPARKRKSDRELIVERVRKLMEGNSNIPGVSETDNEIADIAAQVEKEYSEFQKLKPRALTENLMDSGDMG